MRIMKAHNDNPFKILANKELLASTYESQSFSKNVVKQKISISTSQKNVCYKKQNKDNEKFVLKLTRDKKLEKETLDEYIKKKREMFLVQYMISVKCEDIKKLGLIAVNEEEKLQRAEQYLEEDAINFDEFIKENDKTSGDAIKIAENETKIKLERLSEIRRLNSQIMSVQSEISKYEDQLQEYETYRIFLESLTPKEWLNEKNIENDFQTSMHTKQLNNDFDKNKYEKIRDLKIGEHQMTKELFFSDPQQLLDIFTELEEQNLSLIQNTQETEEALEEIKKNIVITKCQMEKEANILKEQIDKLNFAIEKENERAKDLDLKAKMFSFCEFASENQEQLLSQLNHKVMDVYKACFSESEISISTLQMLTSIENLLEDLLQQIEVMPRNKVEAAEKIKERERRLKQRAEKFEAQRVLQNERMEKALQRANAEPKKKIGRRLVFRSEPPHIKRFNTIEGNMINKDEEELAYYFLP